MKVKKLLLLLLFCGAVSGLRAQNVPTHEKYVSYYEDGVNSKAFYDYFPSWEPGKPLGEDENFFIARVPMKKRFVNPKTQVNPALNPDRKFCLWTPMGISDTYWQSLPRYVFDGDNFSMWSYMDYQGGWSAPWIRMPAAYADVTHKNGVRNSGGLIFFDSWGGDNTNAQKCVSMLVERNYDGSFKYAKKLAQFLRYYGLDGIGINPEGFVPSASLFQDFIIDCRA